MNSIDAKISMNHFRSGFVTTTGIISTLFFGIQTLIALTGLVFASTGIFGDYSFIWSLYAWIMPGFFVPWLLPLRLLLSSIGLFLSFNILLRRRWARKPYTNFLFVCIVAIVVSLYVSFVTEYAILRSNVHRFEDVTVMVLSIYVIRKLGDTPARTEFEGEAIPRKGSRFSRELGILGFIVLSGLLYFSSKIYFDKYKHVDILTCSLSEAQSREKKYYVGRYAAPVESLRFRDGTIADSLFAWVEHYRIVRSDAFFQLRTEQSPVYRLTPSEHILSFESRRSRFCGVMLMPERARKYWYNRFQDLDLDTLPDALNARFIEILDFEDVDSIDVVLHRAF